MPGAYAHITLVNLFRETARLERDPDFPREAISALLKHFQFCELGAVSPDYPYLVLGFGQAKAAAWADTMHSCSSGQILRAGVSHLRTWKGKAQRKGLAWLMGFTAHVVADVKIHPVVNIKVGPYEQNKKAHRVCEMNQDAHVYGRLNLGEIGLAEHLDTGIRTCHAASKRTRLDGDIKRLWKHMLRTAAPAQYKATPPDMDKWHHLFGDMVDNIAEEGNRLLPWARHLGVDSGLTYPAVKDIAPEFIRGLEVPGGQRLDYDVLFDAAAGHLTGAWKAIAQGVLGPGDEYLTALGDWSLDTGTDTAGKLVFWS